MKVSSIMSSPVVTVEMDDSLATVKQIFANTKFHHLLVVEDKRLFGVISDRDLFKAISPNLDTAAEKNADRMTLNKRAHQIMSRQPIAIEQNEKVSQALALFNQHTISCIPVVDEQQRPVGILSWRDIFKIIKINGQ